MEYLGKSTTPDFQNIIILPEVAQRYLRSSHFTTENNIVIIIHSEELYAYPKGNIHFSLNHSWAMLIPEHGAL